MRNRLRVIPSINSYDNFVTTKLYAFYGYEMHKLK